MRVMTWNRRQCPLQAWQFEPNQVNYPLELEHQYSLEQSNKLQRFHKITLTMSSVLCNITQYMKNQENVIHSLGKRQSTYANSEMTQMLKLSKKVTITNTLSEKKLNILIMNKKTWNLGRLFENVKKPRGFRF